MNFYFLQEAIAGAFLLIIFVPIAVILFLVSVYYIVQTVEKISAIKSIAKMEEKEPNISNQVFVLTMLGLLILYIINFIVKIFTMKYS